METINKLYFYKMTTDNGGAPCSYNSILTLAICKPKIRSTAEENDWIVGFGGKELGEKLIYIAQVTKKLLNGEYYKNKKYHERPDCIYRWDATNKKYYWAKGKKYHVNGLNLDHDLDNERALVLLSEKYIYFGNKGTTAYKLKYTELDKYLDGFKQGHRVNHSEALFNELQKLIQATINLKIEGKPSNPDSCKACDNIDGDVVVSTSIFTKCA